MTTAPLSLEHLIKPSAITDGKPPVLFMFHGYGSNEEDLFSFAPELPEKLCIISVRAPYPMQPFGNAWYAINFDNENGKWSDDEQAIQSREKIIEKIKNVIALSGYINEGILVDDLNAKNYDALKIYISHGQVDQVIPPAWAQRAPDFLKNLGIEHMYEEFPVGHGVSPQNFYSFKNWLVDKI